MIRCMLKFVPLFLKCHKFARLLVGGAFRNECAGCSKGKERPDTHSKARFKLHHTSCS
jgi:hypothetical protein